MIRNINISGLLLAVILFLFACDDPNKLGLDLQRDDQRISTFVTDTFTIETSMKLVDTLNTTVNSTSGRGLVGSINDSQFGIINSMSFGNFLLPMSTERSIHFSIVKVVAIIHLHLLLSNASVVTLQDHHIGYGTLVVMSDD